MDIQKEWRNILKEVVDNFMEDIGEEEVKDLYGSVDGLEIKKSKLRNEIWNKIDRYFDNAVLECAKRITSFNDSGIKLIDKENESVKNFLYSSPPLGGMPDSSLRIGVGFEVGGAYEDWGFIVEKDGKVIATGRSLMDVLSKARTKIKEDFDKQEIEKCSCGNQVAIYHQLDEDTRVPLCMTCWLKM